MSVKSFREFNKIRRGIVGCFQDLVDEKNEILQVFGHGSNNFTCDTQPYNFSVHYNKKDTD